MNPSGSSAGSYQVRALGFSRNERGMILPLTLMILLVLASLVVALLAMGALEPQIAANVLRGNQALALAEAGAERAIAHFLADSTPVSCAMATPADGCPAPAPAGPTTLYNAVNLDTLGTYTVTYRPISFATLLIESTGQTSIGGASRIVRVVVTRHYVSRFGVLGNNVELEGDAKVKGTAGAVHGNQGTELKGDSVFVEKTATSSGVKCEGCTTPCGPCDPSSPASRGVGMSEASGPGRLLEPIPAVRPVDLLGRATIILGGGGDFVPPVPAGCAGTVRTPNGTLVVPPPATVPARTILSVVPLGALPVCTLTPENTGIFAGWRMQGGGDWQFAGGTTPPDGAYYAASRIEVRASPGTPATPWKATFISGNGRDEGEVQITGHPSIVSFLDDLLIVAGEIELEGIGGTASLSGAVVSTATDDGDSLGEARLKGSANLIGNIIAHGEIEVGGHASVTYSVGTRTRFFSPTLRILSWSTAQR